MLETIKEFGIALLQATIFAAIFFLPMVIYFGWIIKE
jgi:hypothetical protein